MTLINFQSKGHGQPGELGVLRTQMPADCRDVSEPEATLVVDSHAAAARPATGYTAGDLIRTTTTAPGPILFR